MRTGVLAKSDNPDTWVDFQTVLREWKRQGCDGIGLCRTDDLVSIDLDGVLEPSGAIKPLPWTSKIMATIEGRAYIEASATGTGIHAVCRGRLPQGRRQLDVPGLDHTGFAFYDKSRFFIFTGCVLPQTGTIQDLTPDLEALHQYLFPLKPSVNSSGHHVMEPLRLGDSDLLERAHSAKNGLAFSRLWAGNITGYPSQSEADMALCCHLAFWTGRDATRIDALFRQSGLYRKDKWERTDYRERTIAAAIEKTGETYDPNRGRRSPRRGSIPMWGPGRDAEEAPGAPDLVNGFDPEDVGNGQRFLAMCRDIVRWCPERGKWLVWDGQRWGLDNTDQVRVLAQEVMTEFGIQAMKSGKESLMRFAAGCRRSARITNALREAQPHLSIQANRLDTDPWLLNFQNGTLDLRTGELLPNDPERYITKVIEHDYNSHAQCPLFFRFLERITSGGPDSAEAATARSERLMVFLQRAFGYSLTGVTSEKVVFLLYGPHDNGKSTLLALFLELLGPYAVLLQIESLMTRQQENNNAQADLADLNGARFVMTSETEEGQRLAEGKLKRITQGTGRIKAARKFENPIEFNESHKLWIDCNFLPVIRGHDEAIWRRLRTIPFNVVIPPGEQDRNLSVKLLREAEGILAWAVKGALDWQMHGLPRTAEVENAGTKWREDADQIGRFIENCCVMLPSAQEKASALYSDYKKWAEDSGERFESEKKFAQRMQERDFKKEHKEGGKVYFGIRLRTDL